MFFSIKYARALSNLGMSGNRIKRYESDAILKHGDQYNKMGKTPIEAATSMFSILIKIKINESPNTYIPVALAAQAQILQWYEEGKLDEETNNETMLQILEAMPE